MDKTRSIRISNKAFDFIKERANQDYRSMTDTLDFFIAIFREAEDEAKLENQSLSPSGEETMPEQKVD